MRIAVGRYSPETAPDAWVAPNATLVGRVVLGARSSVWYSAVLRAEYEAITVGPESNVQDGCALHVDMGFPLTLGERVSVGHNAVLHGCTIGDEVLVGMGAVVLNGASIGEHVLVAAGALVPQGMQVPAGTLVAGVPAKVRRDLSEDELQLLRANAEVYLDLARQHAGGHQLL